MRDPIWFKEFEREYNEREDHIAELKEKYKPAKKEWVGLTNDEIESIALTDKFWFVNCDASEQFEWGAFAIAIEAKLKEKNGMD